MRTQSEESSIIDAHTHIVAPDQKAYPLRPQADPDPKVWFRAAAVSAEQLIEHLDAAGVQTAIVAQAMSSYGDDNRYLIDSVIANPDRLIGVGAIDYRSAPDPPASASALSVERAILGIRLFDLARDHGPTFDARLLAVVDVACRARLPIAMMIDWSALGATEHLLESYPEAQVVLDHCAGPDLSGGPPWSKADPVFRLERFPNLHLKITSQTLDSVGPDSDPAELVRDTIAIFGSDRVLWGSDFPHTYYRSYEELVERGRMSAHLLSEADRKAYLGLTARRLMLRDGD